VADPLVHLFDGHVYIFRAYYSISSMEAPDGTPTNAAYGFASTLIKYAAMERLTHGAVCFDHAMTSFRNEIEPEYKAQRGETPDDLEPQFDICREVAEALGFAVFEKQGFEADDLLACLCSQLVRKRARARVLTTDKDLAQLVREDGRVTLYDLARERHCDADGVRERFGVDPAQIPDYLGLVGDTVDNLPGVPGVGPKSAAAVLQAFGSVEAIPQDHQAWPDVPVRGAAGIAKRIAGHRERALRTKDLATVCYEVPGVKPTLSDLRYRGARREYVEVLFDRLGWHAIMDRIPLWDG
jgi:DNA polymerase-1